MRRLVLKLTDSRPSRARRRSARSPPASQAPRASQSFAITASRRLTSILLNVPATVDGCGIRRSKCPRLLASAGNWTPLTAKSAASIPAARTGLEGPGSITGRARRRRPAGCGWSLTPVVSAACPSSPGHRWPPARLSTVRPPRSHSAGGKMLGRRADVAGGPLV